MNNQGVLNDFDGPRKAVVYIRVSSEEQVENYSLGTQEEICKREAKYKGFEIIKVFREEGRSAKTITGRPVLLEMLDFCRKNKREIRAIFIYRLDRLSRQTSDYLAIKKKLTDYNIAIISANEPTGNSPTEKLLETILASFAQHDNDVRSERTKNGMRARFLSGLVSNHTPFGYVNQNGYAIKDPKTFDIYKKAWDQMATGTKSLREITDLLNEWGIKTAKQTVQKMFRNKFYIGVLTSKSYPEEIRGQHIPMITEEQFYKVQAILDGRDTNKLVLPRKSRDNPDFPLRRIVRCGKCQVPFTGAWSKYHKYAYYFCRKRCIPTSIPVKTLEDEFLKKLEKLTPTERGVKFYCNYLLKTYNKKLAMLQKTRKSADEEIQKLQVTRQALIEKNLAGIYSDEIFREQNAVLEDKIIAAQASKSDALVDKYDINAITAFIKDKISNLPLTYSNSKLNELRSLLGSIFISGFTWDYPGISNCRISPLYQPILDSDSGVVNVGCRAWIRTKINGSKVRCPTIRRLGNVDKILP